MVHGVGMQRAACRAEEAGYRVANAVADPGCRVQGAGC